MLPEFLSHYYKADQEPFRSLSLLAGEEALRVASGITEENSIAASRTDDWRKYLQDRKSTESRTRTKFVEKGGEPVLMAPYYFVLGRAESYFEKYEQNLARLELDLADVVESEVSFTYGDSMINELILAGEWPHPEPKKQDWHGKVFLYSELSALIDDLGLPSDWRFGKEPYIEAQVWVEIDRSSLRGPIITGSR